MLVGRAPAFGRFKAGRAGWPTAEELERRRETYSQLLNRAVEACRRGDLDDSLVSSYAAAQVAYLHHFGLWVDPQLEDLTSELARAIEGALPTTPAGGAGERHRFVHVTSQITDAGGHTAL